MFGFRVEPVESASDGADPDIAVAVLHEIGFARPEQGVGTQRGRIRILMDKGVNPVGLLVESRQPPAACGEPEVSGAVFQNGGNAVCQDQPGGLGDVFEPFAIIAIDPVDIGADPHESVPVLNHGDGLGFQVGENVEPLRLPGTGPTYREKDEERQQYDSPNTHLATVLQRLAGLFSGPVRALFSRRAFRQPAKAAEAPPRSR